MSDGLLPEILREKQFAGNTDAFAGLREYMVHGDLTALTGAGVSVPIFPTWIAMLSRWLDDAVRQGFISEQVEVDEYKDLLKNDPLQLAEFLEQILTKPIFRARLAEIFRNKSAQATDCHRLISDLPLRGIVTLNYDNGHEIAYAANRTASSCPGFALDRHLGTATRCALSEDERTLLRQRTIFLVRAAHGDGGHR
jgi:hypothetical protein